MKLICDVSYHCTLHYIQMGLYTVAHKTLRAPITALLPRMSKENQFKYKRLLEQFQYGSGLDYTYQPARDE
jgi:hypothetical protein